MQFNFAEVVGEEIYAKYVALSQKIRGDMTDEEDDFFNTTKKQFKVAEEKFNATIALEHNKKQLAEMVRKLSGEALADVLMSEIVDNKEYWGMVKKLQTSELPKARGSKKTEGGEKVSRGPADFGTLLFTTNIEGFTQELFLSKKETITVKPFRMADSIQAKLKAMSESDVAKLLQAVPEQAELAKKHKQDAVKAILAKLK